MIRRLLPDELPPELRRRCPERRDLILDRIDVERTDTGYRALIYVVGAALPSTYFDAPDPDEAEARATAEAIKRGWRR